VGIEKLDKVIKAYYNDWKFKHPYPEDLKAEFKKQLSINVDGVFEMLNKSGKLL
jgi:hypothetical protein